MKKNLLYLASILVLLLVPAFIVSAEGTVNQNLIAQSDAPVSGNNDNKTVTITSSTGSQVMFNTVKVTYTVGDAIENFKCDGGTDWNVTQTDDGTVHTCVYTAKDSKTRTGTSIAIGTITYYNNPSGTNCDINSVISDAAGETPETGAELPYVILFSGVALAGIAFLSTSKKTKIHQI